MGFRILAYCNSCNLGDAIQTYAASRLLPQPLVGVYREQAAVAPASDQPFFVNGWLGDKTPDDPNCIFAGVYIGGYEAEQIRWIKQSRYPIGARDGYTLRKLAQHGIESTLIGCATLTLPRYEGPRSGILNVDCDGSLGVKLTNWIRQGLGWPQQWELANARLAQLRSAELVYTARLHVVLPCLAFGTPVVFPKANLKSVFQPNRLSILDSLRFEYGEKVTMNVEPFASGYTDFVSRTMENEVAVTDNPAIPAVTATD